MFILSCLRSAHSESARYKVQNFFPLEVLSCGITLEFCSTSFKIYHRTMISKCRESDLDMNIWYFLTRKKSF